MAQKVNQTIHDLIAIEQNSEFSFWSYSADSNGSLIKHFQSSSFVFWYQANPHYTYVSNLSLDVVKSWIDFRIFLLFKVIIFLID